MTTGKRKQPDRPVGAKAQGQVRAQGAKAPARARPAPPRRGLGMRALTWSAGLAVRNPSVFGGSAVFAIVFSFVAANALWYQPGVHPAPFLRTRLPMMQPNGDPARDENGGLAPRKVTTFVIRREGEALPEPEVETASLGEQPADGDGTAVRALGPRAEAEEAAETVESLLRRQESRDAADAALITDIQKALVRRGLYDGEADGKAGPKTAAAIRRFEKAAGRPETGEADAGLLAALREKPGERAAVRPQKRPYETANAQKDGVDPVAAAIRKAEIDPQYIPGADIPATASGARSKETPSKETAKTAANRIAATDAAAAAPASADMVMTIQKGLSNLAYAEVSIDGVAGEQTRAAIRHFEKHYRLPQTGEPNARVLKKLKEIGAL